MSNNTNAQIFDRRWLEFWRAEKPDEEIAEEAARIVALANLLPEALILDLGCGAGALSYALCVSGMNVVAVDRSWECLTEAAKRPHPRSLVIRCDWCLPAWGPVFDCALFWFTTLCAGRKADLEALHVAKSSLRASGTLLVETRHWDSMVKPFEPVTERRSGRGVLREIHSYDPVTGMQHTEEHFEVSGEHLVRNYCTRRYGFPELREMCLEAGFRVVDGFDERGLTLTPNSKRCILRARG